MSALTADDRRAPSTVQRAGGVVKLLRPKQWVKNGFVVAPLIFSGLYLDADAILATVFATALFCVASSTVYVLNDLHDAERDRQHPIKSRKRPIASGLVPPALAWVILGALVAIVVVGAILDPRVGIVVGAYLLLNVGYTFWLKNQPVLDIFTIAIGFVLRVVAGTVALEVALSSWMFITTLCLALYLAAVKRRQELQHESALQSRSVLRAYSVALVDRYAEISATGALVFYSLFAVSEQQGLVLTIPLVLYGLFRYWYLTHQKSGGESPTDALLGDVPLLVTVVLWLGVCVLALWPAGSLLPLDFIE